MDIGVNLEVHWIKQMAYAFKAVDVAALGFWTDFLHQR